MSDFCTIEELWLIHRVTSLGLGSARRPATLWIVVFRFPALFVTIADFSNQDTKNMIKIELAGDIVDIDTDHTKDGAATKIGLKWVMHVAYL